MRIMGLDYGSSTIGLAISDELHLTAQGIETIHRKKENHLRKSLARIDELIEEFDVELIVLGYPKNMNNTIGERAKKTEEFAEKLSNRTGLEVVLWDERLTTVEASKTLISGDVRRENRGKVIDKLAAVLILQNYLDYIYNKTRSNNE